MTHYLKFAILQGILLALIAAAALSGNLKLVLESEAKWVIAGLSSVVVYGLINVCRKVWWRASFAAQVLVRCGIVALGASLILALMAMAGGGSANYLMILVNGMLASVFAIGSSVYIDVIAHFLGDDDGSQE